MTKSQTFLMPRCSDQSSEAKTGTILVGAHQHPIQKQHSPFANPSTATPLPGQPAAEAYKRGRVQSQDPEKSTIGKKTADQLSLPAANQFRQWRRS